MPHRIENVGTELWHRVMDDLTAEGFSVVYVYGGADAGVDYSRYDLQDGAGELIVFEWDNWSEGEIEAAPARLRSLREKYHLSEVVEK
jgi:hypothetical protein